MKIWPNSQNGHLSAFYCRVHMLYHLSWYKYVYSRVNERFTSLLQINLLRRYNVVSGTSTSIVRVQVSMNLLKHFF